MKKTIRPYLKFLFRDNIAYIVILIVVIILLAITIPYLNGAIADTTVKIDSTQKEVKDLSNRDRILSSVIGENNENLDDDLNLMKTLIPDAEDYFSTIYTLEKLSQLTGFQINSFTVRLADSTAEKISIEAAGIGDSQAFTKLLQNYNVGGGRLITVEKIGVDPNQLGNIKLNLNFYNRKVTSDNGNNTNFQASIQELQKLKAKVNFALTSATESAQVKAESEQIQQTDYPIKSNPF